MLPQNLHISIVQKSIHDIYHLIEEAKSLEINEDEKISYVLQSLIIPIAYYIEVAVKDDGHDEFLKEFIKLLTQVVVGKKLN